MATPLITVSRATELIPNFPSGDTSVMTDIVNAASDTVVRFCNNPFVQQLYDNVYDGSGARNLLLYHYPINYIKRISTNPTNCCGIHQTNNSCSRASWRLDGDTSQPPNPNNLYLESALNGVITNITIGPLTSATPSITVNSNSPITIPQMFSISDLANAINTYAGSYGWQATALGMFGTWPIADVRPPQGAMEARWYGYAFLQMFALNFYIFDFNPEVGEIVSPQGFDFGYRNYRVIASCGYSEVPNPVQQATAALAVAVYNSIGVNTNLQSESLGSYNYTTIADKTFHNLDMISRYGLFLYKNHRIAKYKVTV